MDLSWNRICFDFGNWWKITTIPFSSKILSRSFVQKWRMLSVMPLFSAHDWITMVAKTNRNAPMDGCRVSDKGFSYSTESNIKCFRNVSVDRCMQLLNRHTEYSDQTSLQSTKVCIMDKLFSVKVVIFRLRDPLRNAVLLTLHFGLCEG